MDNDLYGKIDLSSFSRTSEAVSLDIKLEWLIDFTSQTVSGTCEHIVKILKPGVSEICFDSSKLHIIGNVIVGYKVGSYTLSDEDPILGRCLTVQVPPEHQYDGNIFSIQFKYSTDPAASAIQWLNPANTKGKSFPFVFTQSQAIHARTLLPCMDTPGVKATYSATVTAPSWCTVLMSAVSGGSVANIQGETRVFEWKQNVPVPAYLIALAAGQLDSKDISDRVRIWAEPSVLADATYEFSETEDFLAAAEKITGVPYAWHRYDVLCLPPSFPYGGMENPCLTFATPTLLAGDRSLADVIAHEIAHSWTGNLVTNHTWAHFWLNEGWTVWLERKIASRVKGVEHGKLSAQINWQHLVEDVARMGAENPFTQLIWPLNGQDPDDAFSSVPYEKGFNLLNYLENLVGETAFLAFVQLYIEKYGNATITTGEFRDCFVSFFQNAIPSNPKDDSTPQRNSDSKKNKKKTPTKSSKAPPRALPSWVGSMEEHDKRLQNISLLDWNSLFLSRGLPTYATAGEFSNSLSTTATNLAELWIQYAKSFSLARQQSKPPPAELMRTIYEHKIDGMKGWSSQQTCLFLEHLSAQADGNDEKRPADMYPVEFFDALDGVYCFSTSRNSEILLRWQSLCLRSEYTKVLPQVVEFITKQGRMKFVRPLYRLLFSVAAATAVETFDAFKDFYHPIARKMINSDLQKAIAACTSEKTVEETVNEEDGVEEVQTLETSSKEVDGSETITEVVEKELNVSLSTGTETPSVPDAKQDYLWEVIPPAELLPPDDVPLTLTAPDKTATERAESLVEEAACTSEKTVEETVNEEDGVEEVQTLETSSKEVDGSEILTKVVEKELDVSLSTGTETPSVPDAKQDCLWEVIPPAELLPPDDVPLTLTTPVTTATERIESLVEEESTPESGPISEKVRGVFGGHPSDPKETASPERKGWKLLSFLIYGIAVAAMIAVESKRKS